MIINYLKKLSKKDRTLKKLSYEEKQELAEDIRDFLEDRNIQGQVQVADTIYISKPRLKEKDEENT